MNKILDKFARDYIRKNLVLCSEGAQEKFKFMYYVGKFDADKIKKTSTNEVIDKMLNEKLDWAMVQVNNTMKKEGIINESN